MTTDYILIYFKTFIANKKENELYEDIGWELLMKIYCRLVCKRKWRLNAFKN